MLKDFFIVLWNDSWIIAFSFLYCRLSTMWFVIKTKHDWKLLWNFWRWQVKLRSKWRRSVSICVFLWPFLCHNPWEDSFLLLLPEIGMHIILYIQDSNQLEVLQVSSPLLILHGAADKVTDPLVSQFLYEKASTKDKTLKLYDDGYHCILEGEPDDGIFTVLNDIVSWLDSRVSS